MAVLYNWSTRLEGRSCLALVLIYWRKKKQPTKKQQPKLQYSGIEKIFCI